MTRPISSPTITAAGLLLELGESGGPLSQRLMTALRDGIREGRLTPGAALPPSRALATELGCSRWVVTEAYGQLVAEGYLEATVGSATRVRDLGVVDREPAARAPAVPRRARFDLAPGVPDLAAFPRSRWAEAYRRAVQERRTDQLAASTMVPTNTARTAITDYLIRTRQIRADPARLRMSTGAADGTGWLARLLRSLGHRRVAVEDPSWPGLRDAARWAGLEPVPIDVDGDGLCVHQLDRHRDVRLVIATPAHQFPTGVALSPTRRSDLIRWAERVDGLIIEDDYDAEFRYDRRPVASLHGMAPDRVALVGSVSKSLGPAIGLGWVVPPPWLTDRIVADDLERAADPSVFAVEALATMIGNGWYERHLRGMRMRYRKRRELLTQAIASRLPDCEPSGMAAGMHLLLRLPDGVDAGSVAERARQLEVGVVELARYRLRAGSPDTLVIGYGNLRSGQEDAAVERLAAAIASCRTGRD